MKLLGIAGSPRRGGNTDILLNRFMEGASSQGWETKTLIASNLKIAGCKHCDACLEKGICRIQDDMQRVYRELEDADALAIAAPLQFMTIPSELKGLVDRCQALWARKYVLKVPPLGDSRVRQGFFICVGGRRTIPNLFDAALITVKTFYRILDIAYAGDLLIPGIDAMGDILKHPEYMEQAFQAGQNLSVKSDSV